MALPDWLAAIQGQPLPPARMVGPSSPYAPPNLSSLPGQVGASAALTRGAGTVGTARTLADIAADVAAMPRPAPSGPTVSTFIGPNSPIGAKPPAGLLASGMARMRGLGWRGAGMRLGIPTAIGMIAGNQLDESNLLGGSESAANDYASKALKLGGVGAGIGTMIAPGAGTAIGAGIGGLVGAGWEGLERAGILKNPTTSEAVQEQVSKADAIAREIGLPEQVLSEIKKVHDAQMAFAKDDKAAMANLGSSYEQQVQEAALMYAQDPEGFKAELGIGQAGGGDQATAQQLAMQAVMVDAIKPYADNFLAQSEATAQSLENMAGSAGNLAPMYRQQAAQQRMLGSQFAADIMTQANVTPYQQALRNQAQYLDQMSSNLVQQAMGQVLQGGGGGANAGSMDLTAIIDAQANQLQP